MEKNTKSQAAQFSIQVGWMGLIGGSLLGLLILAWIFVLGVLVGRGDIPNPLEMPFLKKPPVSGSPQTLHTGTENSKSEPHEQQPQPQLDFYNDLNKEGAEVRGVMPKEPVSEKLPDKLTGDVPQKTEEKKPPSKYYTVQLASFKDKAQARLFAEQMHKKEIPCQLSAVNSNGMVWYRVRTGRFQDHASAQVFILSLKEKHRLSPMIVALP
jgi:cell division septation protein DedD